MHLKRHNGIFRNTPEMTGGNSLPSKKVSGKARGIYVTKAIPNSVHQYHASILSIAPFGKLRPRLRINDFY